MGKHSLPDGVYVPGGSASEARLNGVEATEPIPVVAPTQVQHPWRTVARTGFQSIPLVVAFILAALAAFSVPVTAGVGAVAVAVCLGLTRLMAMPEFNALVDRLAPWLRAE